MPTMDHSKMNMQHGNPSLGMEGHNHHAMMIADFKKRFYVVLVLTVPIKLLSVVQKQQFFIKQYYLKYLSLLKSNKYPLVILSIFL